MGTFQLSSNPQFQLQDPGSSNVANEMGSGSGVAAFLNNPLAIPPSDSNMTLDSFVDNSVGDPTTSPGAGSSARKKGKCKATDLD